MSKVIRLRAGRPPIGQFIRIGVSGHRQAEDLIDEGRFPVDRVVIEAAAVLRQVDLIAALRRRHCEIVLDTNVAELSCRGRFDGAVKQAPWARTGRPLEVNDFRGLAGKELMRSIAETAVQHGFSAVLAPTHLLRDSNDPWLHVDAESCVVLREALNRAGGSHIAIDYALMLPYRALRDGQHRAALVSAIKDLPTENLWIRASQFGADASATGVRRYIDALHDFVAIGQPIVADGVAGLAGLATVAFGAAGGMAHGIGDHERFDASDWQKPRKNNGGGLPTRIFVPGLDRHVTREQLELLASANGGRRLVVCNDSECCTRGLNDMINNHKSHYLHQRRKQVESLSQVPEAYRAEHFVNHEVLAAERRGRQISKLRVADPAIIHMLEKESLRLERMPIVLENLLATGLSSQRSISPRLRSTDTAVPRTVQR